LDKRYDNHIQNIFLVLDNLSAHKSKMVKKEEISKCCLRIKFVFLPVRSPELNLIEVEDGYDGYKDNQLIILHSKMNKKEDKPLVFGRKYIIKITATKQSQIFYKRMYPCVYTVVNWSASS
jgi:hypothetical protein